jgi:hypothetical protein
MFDLGRNTSDLWNHGKSRGYQLVCVADIAFLCNNNCFQRITPPLKDNEIERAPPRAPLLDSQIASAMSDGISVMVTL